MVPGSTGTACRVGFAPSRSEQGTGQGSPPGFKHPILWLLIGFKWSRVHPGNLQLAPAQLAGGQQSRSSPSAQQRGWEEDQENNGLVQTIQHQPRRAASPGTAGRGSQGWAGARAPAPRAVSPMGALCLGWVLPCLWGQLPGHPGFTAVLARIGHAQPHCPVLRLLAAPSTPSTHASGCCRVLVLRGKQGLHRAPGEAGGGLLELVAWQGGEEVLPIPLPQAPCPSGRDGGPVLRAELHKRCPGTGWRCWSWLLSVAPCQPAQGSLVVPKAPAQEPCSASVPVPRVH